MDPALVGVLPTVAFGVFAGAFHLLRSDIRRVDTRLDRLEGKLDDLVLALARSGHLADPHAVGRTPPPSAAEPPAP